MLAYADQTSESLAGELRPGNAGANSAADQVAVAEQAIQQIPAEYIETIELLLRVDSAGASHELLDWCREGRIGFSVGYDLTETVRAAILEIPDTDWVPALDQDGSSRLWGVFIRSARFYAATVYSWMRPPSRSRLRIDPVGGIRAGGAGEGDSGGTRPSARCGLWPL
jgi:hypothetical protein